MDWGTTLTGLVFATIVALMGVINSLDRKNAQLQESPLSVDNQEMEGATAN